MANWCSPVDDCTDRRYPQPPWHISNGFLDVYDLGDSEAVHTGEDVNLNFGADIGEPVRAIGAGTVVYAQMRDDSWIGLVVIKHDHDNTFTCSRYGHLTDLSVTKDDVVAAGDLLGKIADTAVIDNIFPAHLHFDIGLTGDDLLIEKPWHWPDKNLTIEDRKVIVTAHYQRPSSFLRPRIAGTAGVVTPPPAPTQPRRTLLMRVDNEFLNIRTERRIAPETFKVRLLEGAELVVFDPGVVQGRLTWREITEPADLRGCWAVERVPPDVDPKEVYLVAAERIEPAPIPVTPPPAEPAPSEPPVVVAPTPTEPDTPEAAPHRIRMRVNIEKVNLRSRRVISPATFAGEAFENTELLVSNPAIVDDNQIHWREIFEPAHLSGTWVAERVNPSVDRRHYLVHVDGESTPTTPSDFTATGATPVTPTEPATITAAAAGPNPAPLMGRFQLARKGTRTVLAIDGATKPALGVNIRELAYFDFHKLEHVNADDRGIFCQEAKSMNMRWVRFFAAHTEFTHDEIVAQTRTALDAISAAGMLAIVVFADSIKNQSMYPKGDDKWHKESDFNHLHKDYFNGGHYKTHYLPLVKHLVTEFRDHPGVGMWQLMNEPAIYPADAEEEDVKGFARFVDDVSAAIYDLDKKHPISIGIINVAHIMPPSRDLNQFAEEFYAARQHIHVISCHAYQHKDKSDANLDWDQEDRAQADINAAAKTGRALFWTEIGASQAGDRKAATERFLNRHVRDNQASGALQWGFMIGPNFAKDKGVGDKDFGMSTADFNKQYDDLKQLYTHFVATID